MTNKSKWLYALPFTLVVAFLIPACVARALDWFLASFTDVLYVAMTAGMWLAATAFVDVERPRGPRDLANLLLPLGLIISVPVAVFDRRYLTGSEMGATLGWAGLVLSAAAVALGIAARRHLGAAYAPQAGPAGGSNLVQSGPYGWIRHPLYAAAILWSLGWPLVLRSPLGALAALIPTLIAVGKRMGLEERGLEETFGAQFDEYRQKTWRLIPYVY